jgi:hypothetical protein
MGIYGDFREEMGTCENGGVLIGGWAYGDLVGILIGGWWGDGEDGVM